MNDRPMNSDVTMRSGNTAALGRIDQYLIVSELSSGAWGAVYLAKDLASGREVVVKGLPPEVKYGQDELEILKQSFIRVDRLHHPNIASLLCLRRAEEVIYCNPVVEKSLGVMVGDVLMVMEHVPGVELSKWSRQFPGGKVPVDKAIEIARQVASALDYAHAQKIIHRDLNPSHVMVETGVDGGPIARVLGFGLSALIRELVGRSSERVRSVSGARPYLSPEQWRGAKPGPATDQYALGVIAYEMIAGALPIHNAVDLELHDFMLCKVPPINAVAPYINDALARAMARVPNERFGNCMEFVSALNKKSGLDRLARWWRLLKGDKQ